jgi:hypothetical protein
MYEQINACIEKRLKWRKQFKIGQSCSEGVSFLLEKLKTIVRHNLDKIANEDGKSTTTWAEQAATSATS